MNIYVDGCCNNKIGAWASVTDKNGNDLIGPNLSILEQFDFLPFFERGFHLNRVVFKSNFTDVTTQQNNGAELLAMVIGLSIAIFRGYEKLCSDSNVSISWSKKISPTIKCPLKQKLQRLCVKLRERFYEQGGEIIKISGDDNPADLGFHKN